MKRTFLQFKIVKITRIYFYNMGHSEPYDPKPADLDLKFLEMIN